jgi:hypothetical protein
MVENMVKHMKYKECFVPFSPSSTRLCSYADLRAYLLAEDTCKCGLECPLMLEKTFTFDPQVASRAWCPDPATSGSRDLSQLCSHKRKTAAMAALQNTANHAAIAAAAAANKGKDTMHSLLGM